MFLKVREYLFSICLKHHSSPTPYQLLPPEQREKKNEARKTSDNDTIAKMH
jgi:hypothetical protein